MIEKRFSIHKTVVAEATPAQILNVLNGNGTNTGSSAGQTSTGSSAWTRTGQTVSRAAAGGFLSGRLHGTDRLRRRPHSRTHTVGPSVSVAAHFHSTELANIGVGQVAITGPDDGRQTTPAAFGDQWPQRHPQHAGRR